MKDLKLSTIEAALLEGNEAAKDAAVKAVQGMVIPCKKVKKWLTSDNYALQRAGLASCARWDELTGISIMVAEELVNAGRFMEIRDSFGRALEECQWITRDAILDLAESDKAEMRYFAMRAIAGTNGPCFNDLIDDGLNDLSPMVMAAAADAAREGSFSVNVLDTWRKSANPFLRLAAMNVMVGRGSDLPFWWIVEAITDDDRRVRVAAAKAAAERRIPERCVLEWMNDAVNAEQALALIWNLDYHMGGICRVELPPQPWMDFLWNNVKSKDVRVATAATELFGVSRLPAIRNGKTDGLVYKRCLGGVVVLAEIPSRAHVRITHDDGFVCSGRASEAIIREVVGDFYGEKVGISHYDHATQYREGDEVMVSDYDTVWSRPESTGFYFYRCRGWHDDYLFREDDRLFHYWTPPCEVDIDYPDINR